MYQSDITKVKAKLKEFFTGYSLKSTIDEGWVERCEESHQALRAKIGGISKTYEVKTHEPIKIDGCKYADISLIVGNLYDFIPGYFLDNNLQPSDLICPYIPEGRWKGRRWAKSIEQFLIQKKFFPESKQRILDLVARLGQHWNNQTEVTYDLEITVSTDPEVFAHIGHNNGIDARSCLRNEQLHDVHKLIFGQTANTFVGFITNQNNNDRVYYKKRFLGVYQPEDNVLHITNFYGILDTQALSIKLGIQAWAQQFLGVQEIHRLTDHVKFRGVWQNQDSVTFAENTNHKYIVHFNDEHLKFYRQCYKCAYRRKEEFTLVDRNFYICSACMQTYAKTCEYSGEKTLKPLVEATTPDKMTKRVCNEMIKEQFFKSDQDDKLYHNDLKIVTDTCLWLASTQLADYIQCHNCQRYCNNQQTECSNCNASLTVALAA